MRSQNEGFSMSRMIVSRSLNTDAISVTEDIKPLIPDNGFSDDPVSVCPAATVMLPDCPACERIESA